MKRIDSDTKVLIVGLGLIGGSYAKALTKKGCKIRAITRKDSDIEYSVKEGFIEDGTTEVTEEYLAWADIIVFSLYPHTLLEWLKKYAGLIKKGTVCTDVTGVKSCVVYDAQALMPDGVEFIAAHPMAGRERSGVRHSDESVFIGANYIVVPTDKNTPEAVEYCKQLGEALGFYRVSVLDPESHDRMIAFLSQLTHCIAVSLMCTNDTPGFEAYTGDSFRDLTRIAKINGEMWSELFISNKQFLLAEMDNFINQFTLLRNMLENEDKEGMCIMMQISTQRREKFDKPKVKEG